MSGTAFEEPAYLIHFTTPGMHSPWNIVSAQWVFSEWIQKNAQTLEELNRKKTNAQVRLAKEEGESGREHKENATMAQKRKQSRPVGKM